MSKPVPSFSLGVPGSLDNDDGGSDGDADGAAD